MDNKTMGELISKNRKAKNMTQAQLAEKMGVTDKAVSKWERNISCPDIALMSKLAETIGVSIAELVDGEKSEKNGFQEIEKKDIKMIISVVLKCVGMALGIGTFVLNSIMHKITTQESITLLTMAVVCLGLHNFLPENK